MQWPTAGQQQAFWRNVGSGVAGAVAMGAFLGLSNVDGEKIINAVNQIGTATTAIVTALGVLVPILAGLFAGNKASPSQQAARIIENPDLHVTPITEKGVAIVNKAMEIAK